MPDLKGCACGLFPEHENPRMFMLSVTATTEKRHSVALARETNRSANLVLALKWKHMGDRDRAVVDELAVLEREIRGY